MRVNQKIAIAPSAGAVVGGLAVHGLQAQGKPPAYLITEVEVLDNAAFREYAPKAGKVLVEAGAKYLVRGGQIVALEGQTPTRVVVQVFENMEKAEAYRDSAAYKELAPLRGKAVKDHSYIVEGIAN